MTAVRTTAATALMATLGLAIACRDNAAKAQSHQEAARWIGTRAQWLAASDECHHQ